MCGLFFIIISIFDKNKNIVNTVQFENIRKAYHGRLNIREKHRKDVHRDNIYKLSCF